MEGGSHLLHHQQHHHQQQQQSVHHHMQQQQMSMSGGAAGPMSSTGLGGGGVDAGGVGALDNRFPQWSIQETKEFLMIRGELDQTFMETKRNKLLWEITSTRMREKGFNRSSEQCKCKWKNLVTRYKGCETMEPEAMRQQFPYYNEMQAIFTDRMQRMLWTEAGGGGATTPHGSNKNKNITFQQLSSEEDDDEQDSDLQYNYGEKPIIATTPTTTTIPTSSGFSRKVRKQKSKTNLANIGATSSGTGGSAGGGNNNNSNFIALKELLEDFMKQQVQMEMQWREMYEAREEERRMKEMEWRQRMEALENERLMMERRWIEREEQRRIRDEARADKRDALITALLNKLRRDES